MVAPGNPAFPVRDPSLMGVLPPGLEVHRTRSFEPGKIPNAMENRLNRPSGKARPSGMSAAAGESGARAADMTSASMGASRRLRILRKLTIGWNRVWAVLLYPDTTVAWMPFACWAGWRAHRRKRVDIVFSSALPITAHMAGGMVAKLTRRPWVADFRDPWIGNPFTARPGRLKRWLQRRTERGVVKRAARVVFAMDLLREMYVERYPEYADKFVFIPNGYDRADLVEIEPAPYEPGRFHLLFAGSLYRPQELDAFLGGVEVLVKRRPDMRGRLKVHFVGRVNEANSRTGAEFSRPERLGDMISFEGFVPRNVALARMAGADALLQLMPDEPGTRMFVGGKLLEYLAMDRPIFVVMPHGEGRQLVDSLPAGRSADVEPASVADALERLVDDPPAKGPADPAGRFDRVNLTAELGRLFDEVAEEHARRA